MVPETMKAVLKREFTKGKPGRRQGTRRAVTVMPWGMIFYIYTNGRRVAGLQFRDRQQHQHRGHRHGRLRGGLDGKCQALLQQPFPKQGGIHFRGGYGQGRSRCGRP